MRFALVFALLPALAFAAPVAVVSPSASHSSTSIKVGATSLSSAAVGHSSVSTSIPHSATSLSSASAAKSSTASTAYSSSAKSSLSSSASHSASPSTVSVSILKTSSAPSSALHISSSASASSAKASSTSSAIVSTGTAPIPLSLISLNNWIDYLSSLKTSSLSEAEDIVANITSAAAVYPQLVKTVSTATLAEYTAELVKSVNNYIKNLPTSVSSSASFKSYGGQFDAALATMFSTVGTAASGTNNLVASLNKNGVTASSNVSSLLAKSEFKPGKHS
ncbi:hypothetical protein P7C73_g2719, partial [Tremellales sp. Uapishka_1]